MLDDLAEHPACQIVDQDFLERTVQMLQGLQRQIRDLIASGDLEIDVLASNNIIRYNTFHEELISIEVFRYLIIINYGEAEEYFKKKIARIYDEINCFQKLPIVTTISNSQNYYWALPNYDIIAVPAKEEKNLLNLPDIYHEVGHLIFHQFEQFMVGDIHDQIRQFYAEEIQRVDDEERPADLIPVFTESCANWISSWVMEFTCDFLATYLVGPAYAWTNLKISTLSSGAATVYTGSASHPSDEARMRGILYVLTNLGHHQQVAQIDQSWERFLNVTINPQPAHYDYIFPQHIIEALAEFVIQGCRDNDLLDFQQQAAECEYPISKLLNDAWDLLMVKPGSFADWEQERIEEIKEG